MNCEADGQTENILREVCAAFRIPGELKSWETITRGNINTTFHVNFYNPDGQPHEIRKSYLVQEVNAYVFKNPKEIMRNIDRVTAHISAKSPGTPQLHFHHTADGMNYYVPGNGSFWRLSNYIDSVTFDTCADLAILRSTGKAFGRFQALLSDFDAESLYETIPDFHNTEKRLDRLFQSAKDDPCDRAKEVRDELCFLDSLRDKATELCRMRADGALPLRVTHNDTKVNNVLFDRQTLEPLVVIDLDTVMPGLSAYDFGDAARCAASSAAEDEPDTEKVFLDTERFGALAEGYLASMSGVLTRSEIDVLALGALTLTVELASRFLDDYLTGDKYFRTSYAGHNLVRTRCQLKLAADILEKLPILRKTISDIAKRMKDA